MALLADRQVSTLRLAMAVPPLPALAILTIAWLADHGGHHWNVHGDAIAMVMAFMLSCAVGAVFEIVALVKAVPLLLGQPAQRTLPNMACAAFGLTFLAACLVLVLWGHNSVQG